MKTKKEKDKIKRTHIHALAIHAGWSPYAAKRCFIYCDNESRIGRS